MPLKDLPADARPREKLLARGAARAGRRRAAGAAAAHRPARARACCSWPQQLLDALRRLRRPAARQRRRPEAHQGPGPGQARRDCGGAGAGAPRAGRSSCSSAPVFDTPGQVKDYLAAAPGRARSTRCSRCCSSTRQHRLLQLEEMFRGTLTQTSVYPREVVKRALAAATPRAVILAHNHPSGVAEPSRADEFLTQTLKSALALVDVRVLDHLVVGQGDGGVVRRAGAAVKARSLQDLAALRDGAARSAKPRPPPMHGARERPSGSARSSARDAVRPTPSARCTPLPAARPRAWPPCRGPPPRAARSASATKRAALREAMSDEVDVESLLHTDDGLSFRRRASAPTWCAAAPRPLGDPGADRPARPAPRRGARAARRLPARGAAARPALRARGPRQGPRLARPRAGAQGQGAALAGASKEVIAFTQAAAAGRRRGADGAAGTPQRGALISPRSRVATASHGQRGRRAGQRLEQQLAAQHRVAHRGVERHLAQQLQPHRRWPAPGLT